MDIKVLECIRPILFVTTISGAIFAFPALGKEAIPLPPASKSTVSVSTSDSLAQIVSELRKKEIEITWWDEEQEVGHLLSISLPQDCSHISPVDLRLLATTSVRVSVCISGPQPRLDLLDALRQANVVELEIVGAKLSNNLIKSISQWPCLEQVTFHETSQECQHWAPLRSLQELEAIHLERASLPCQAFEAIALLPCFNELTLVEVGLDRPTWNAIAFLPKLATLHIDQSRLSGNFLQQIASNPTLLSFSAVDCDWNVKEAKRIGSIKQLQELTINSAPLCDEVVTAILRNLSSLKYLDLSHTNITDATASQTAAMKQLEILHLCHTGVTDACIKHLCDLPKLWFVNLENTEVSAKVVLRLEENDTMVIR